MIVQRRLTMYFHSCCSRRTKDIRDKVGSVCSILRDLCETLVQKEDHPRVFDLSTNDSNEFLHGLRSLYKESTEIEQIRLLTIAPADWGRVKIQEWFESTDHQARQALLLRQHKGILAFPEYSRGNRCLPDTTVTLVKEFYLQDGTSRASSYKKDVIQIRKIAVPVRFMEITIREAFRQFQLDYPMVEIGKSSFHSLRPRQVKILAPHETCMCMFHENMNLVLTV